MTMNFSGEAMEAKETMQQPFESTKGKDVSTQDLIVTENTL